MLPSHVINEYCHTTRSFNPCPNFEDEASLPRTRKVTIDKEYEDLFTAQWNGGCLGNSFGLYRGRWRCIGVVVVGVYDGEMRDARRSEYPSITALCSTRTQQRDRLITELGNSSTLKSTLAGRK